VTFYRLKALDREIKKKESVFLSLKLLSNMIDFFQKHLKKDILKSKKVVTWGWEGVKNLRKYVTYYLNGP